MTTARVEPPTHANEVPMLLSWLEFHRSTLAMKCAGLSDDQLREASVPPSSLTLLGLVRHMSKVERIWFRSVFAGEDAERLYSTDASPDGDFDDLASLPVSEVFDVWQRECAAARRVQASAKTLDDLSAAERHGRKVSMRWILVHMIEEYARHNGHADLLRERIDGKTGE
jgi:uncharacterized damage-inducible protein DinB